MKKQISVILPGILLFSFYSCSNNTLNHPDKDQIIQADREFSDCSVRNGMRKAFLDYADSSVVLLRANDMPVEGIHSLWARIKQIPDSLFTLSWEPLHAEISGSGDLGYTYGIYTSIPRDTIGGQKSERGTYITIWKKQRNGGWKYVLDTGNEGVGKK